MIRLDVGCGDACKPGYTGVDPYYEGPDVTVKAPAQALPYEDGTVDEIWCSHCLEHMTRDEAALALAEFRRVLKPGSKMTVIVPDAQYVLQYLIDHPGDPWASMMAWGQKRWPGDAHLTAFDVDTLEAMVKDAGFGGRTISCAWTAMHNQQSIICEVTLP